MPTPTNLQNWPISLAEVRDLHLQDGRINRILAGKESVEMRNAQRIRSGTQPGWSKSTLASVYADELYRESMVRLSQDPGIHFFSVNGQRFIRVSSSKIAAVSRFKKVRANWLSSNYRTSQSIAWNGQIPLLDVPQCPRIEYAYQMDYGKVVRFAVLLRVGDEVVWIWQVSGYPTNKFPFDVPAHELPGIHRSTHQALIHHRYLWEPMDNAVMI